MMVSLLHQCEADGVHFGGMQWWREHDTNTPHILYQQQRFVYKTTIVNSNTCNESYNMSCSAGPIVARKSLIQHNS